MARLGRRRRLWWKRRSRLLLGRSGSSPKRTAEPEPNLGGFVGQTPSYARDPLVALLRPIGTLRKADVDVGRRPGGLPHRAAEPQPYGSRVPSASRPGGSAPLYALTPAPRQPAWQRSTRRSKRDTT